MPPGWSVTVFLTGAGGKRWHASTINKILRNEKYIGDALLQKTYTTDFLNKTRVKNNGLVPQYYVEGTHESIIPKDIYLQVQEELVLQDTVVKAINRMLGDKSSYQAQLQLNIASVIRASQVTSVENIDEKLVALQQELIQKAHSKEAYDEIADEIFRLRELRQQTPHLTEFDESLVRR